MIRERHKISFAKAVYLALEIGLKTILMTRNLPYDETQTTND